jgi:serine/alanine racemase
MYLAWSGIYFVFVLIDWFQSQAEAYIMLNYFHRALVFTTYATIWFLPALLIGVAMVYYLSSRLSFSSILAISVVFYFLGTLGYSYSFLLPAMPKLENIYQMYDRWFFTTRNGVFNAFPFVALGAWMATRKIRIPTVVSAVTGIFFLTLLVVESYTLRLKFGVKGVDTALMLLPFTFFFLEFVLGLRLRDRSIYKNLRDMSVLIFLSHRILVSALPSVLPAPWVSAAFHNSWLALISIILLTLAQSYFFIKLSKKYRFFRILR